jgi:hypothetical protein
MKTILQQAAELFGLETADEKRIGAILWHLGCRETCSRCGGSGEYSYNQRDGTRCFKCNGRRYTSAKLTRAVLADARAKVEAGELVTLRAKWKALAEAKRQIVPLVAEITRLWQESAVSRSYTAASIVHRRYDLMITSLTLSVRDGYRDPITYRWIPAEIYYSPLSLAQQLTNDIWSAAKEIEHATGRAEIDARVAVEKLIELRAMLTSVYAIATPDQIREWGFAVPESTESAA